MQIREATKEDWDAVVRVRLAFVADVNDRTDLPDDLAEQTRAYVLDEHDGRGARSWLAEVDGEVVGGVTLLLRTTPPQVGDPRTGEGYVINMYVAPSHRRGGTARRLFDTLMAAARELDLKQVTLHAKEAARPLYEEHGFTTERSWMQLVL